MRLVRVETSKEVLLLVTNQEPHAMELRKPFGSGLGGFGPVNGLEFARYRLTFLPAEKDRQ